MNGSAILDSLRAKAAPIWDKEFAHPFVQGIGDGTLAPERFKFYLRQDYIFLIDYCRVFGIAAAKARDAATIATFGKLLFDTSTVEMQLHRDYCAQFGISAVELEATKPSMITHAYTRHLLTVAYSAPVVEIVGTLLPCQLGYAEIAARLVREGKTGAGSMYAEWVATYASREFTDLAEVMVEMFASLADELSPYQAAVAEEHFLASSRYEYLFWEMAWEQSGWPI
jgi:thiaminase (transcriptional activator TenA)